MSSSGPCFAHFQLNCKICFPNETLSQAAAAGRSDKSLPQNQQNIQAQSQSNSLAVSNTPVAPGTVSNAPIPGQTGLSLTSSSNGSTSNQEATDDPRSFELKSDTNDINGGKKRKAGRADYRYPSRKKKAVIDCPVAQSIFRSLRLTNKFFNSGNLLAWALSPDDPEYKYIHQYVAVGQVHGHGIKILSVIRIIANASSVEKSDAPVDFNEDPETKGKFRKMLWHGTRRTFVSSIMQNGLKLPTSSCQMFGKGIYFADRISKSVQYCNGFVWTGANAYVFLCDVLLGQMYKSEKAMNYITSPPRSANSNGLRSCLFGDANDSVMGCGRDIPDETGNLEIDGCVWPLGKTLTNAENRRHLPLKYNEYIVYETQKVIPKYLLKVEFTENPYFENIG